MNKIMTHVVAGYPTENNCIELMRGMEQAGMEIIEVQIPFSDPIADGETIMRANDAALERGMTTEKSFELIKKAGLKTDLFVMSYLQKVISFGFSDFCKRAKDAGAKGLIIPDLPFDSKEYEQLKTEANKRGLNIVPVVSPSMPEERLRQAVAGAELVYLTSMRGITGKKMSITTELKQAAKDIKKNNPNGQLAIGFGVSSAMDVNQICKIADIVVVGSSVVRKIDAGNIDSALEFVKNLTK